MLSSILIIYTGGAKIIKITKKNTLGTQLVLNQLIKSGPNNIEIINPRAV